MAHDVSLLGAVDVRALASRLDVTPTKKLGQNFVTDPNTIRRIVAAAKLDGTETVVEIGPGLGSLTLGLLEVANKVIAVEIDPKMAAELESTIETRAPGTDFKLVRNDALKVTELPAEPSALVANLPYNISVPVLLHFLEQFSSIQKGLVLVQAEVAHRLAATPGSKIYGIPSVKLAWYADSYLAGNVGRNIFWPVPNVDSALVFFAKREVALGDEELRLATFAAADAAFGQRRKTLRQALADWAGSPAEAERILIASEAVGLGRAALKRAAGYANEREVFGRPIGQNQGIQHPLAKSWMELEAAHLMVHKAAWLYDQNLPCAAEANSAKYLAAEACYHACENAIFTHGGMGYAKEYHVERYLRESWIPRLAPVSPQLILCFIAEKVLGLPKSY